MYTKESYEADLQKCPTRSFCRHPYDKSDKCRHCSVGLRIASFEHPRAHRILAEHERHAPSIKKAVSPSRSPSSKEKFAVETRPARYGMSCIAPVTIRDIALKEMAAISEKAVVNEACKAKPADYDSLPIVYGACKGPYDTIMIGGVQHRVLPKRDKKASKK